MVELTWEGKYDEHGKCTPPLRLQLPFQTVEMVNESAQERQMALDLFSAGSTGPSTTPLVLWPRDKGLRTGSAGCGAGRVVTGSSTSEVSPTSEVGH